MEYQERLQHAAERYTNEYGFVCLPYHTWGKKPVLKAWTSFKETPFAEFEKDIFGLGILCGESSGITVLDIDTQENGLAYWEKILAKYDSNNEIAITVDTPSGGKHIYFKYDATVKSSAGIDILIGPKKIQKKIGWDIQNNGRQVVAPPTTYTATNPDKKQFEGNPYVLVSGYENLLEMPKWLYDILTGRKIIHIMDGEFDLIEGTQNITQTHLGEESDSDSEQDDEISAIKRLMKSHKNWTFEQVEKMVMGLPAKYYDGYDLWFAALCALAHWSQETTKNMDEDDIDDFKFKVRNLADKFSKQSNKYDDSVFAIKWKDVNKKSASRENRNIGTIIMWLKKDNPTLYEEFFPSKHNTIAAKINSQKRFDPDDPITWNDICEKYNCNVHTTEPKIFDNKQDMMKALAEDIPRVLAIITEGKGMFVKKTTSPIKSKNYDSMFNMIPLKETGTINFQMAYKTIIEKKTKKASIQEEKLIKVWLLDPEIKEIIPKYETVICKPNAIESKYEFNLWQSFAARLVPTIDMKYVDPWIKHIKEVIANNNEDYANYIIKWHAAIVKFPDIPVGVVLAVIGRQGAGKSYLADILQKLLGDHLCQVCMNGIDGITGNWNDHIVGKKLIVLEELKAGARKDLMEKFNNIKALITQKRIGIRKRNATDFMVDNITAIIQYSNNWNSIHIESDDRRYACFEASSKYIGDDKYFDNLYETTSTGEAINHIYTYLMNQDIKSIKEIQGKNIPITELKRDQQDMSKPSWRLHLEYLQREIANEDINDDDDEKSKKKKTIYATELYESYTQWCKKSNYDPMKENPYYKSIQGFVEKATRGKRGEKYDLTTIAF